MNKTDVGKRTIITDGLSVLEGEDVIRLEVSRNQGNFYTHIDLNDVTAIHLRNLLTQWKNERTKRANKERYRKSHSSVHSREGEDSR